MGGEMGPDEEELTAAAVPFAMLFKGGIGACGRGLSVGTLVGGGRI